MNGLKRFAAIMQALAIATLMIALGMMLSVGARAATVAGSVTAAWTLPVDREDGTPLDVSELAGCLIMWGFVSGDYPNVIPVSCADASHTWTFTRSAPAHTSIVVYAVMTVTDSDGEVSDPSAEAKKQFEGVANQPPRQPGFILK